MPSIQLDKKVLQAIIDKASNKDIFAIDISTTTQTAEVMREIETATRRKQRLTVVVVKH